MLGKTGAISSPPHQGHKPSLCRPQDKVKPYRAKPGGTERTNSASCPCLGPSGATEVHTGAPWVGVGEVLFLSDPHWETPAH